MLKNSKIKIVSIVPRLQARLASVMPSYSLPKIVSIKANSVGHGIKPTFTRASTAYKSDGTLVNAGLPRIEAGKGTLVEEGTVNLLPSANQNKLVNGRPDSNYYALTTGLVQGGTYTISGKKRIYADDTLINTRTTIRCNYSDGTNVYKQTTLNAIPKDGEFYVFVLSVTADSAKTLVSVKVWAFDYGTGTLMHQECKNVQLEAKPYATTFHASTRTAEGLTIPASALNASEGTIEFDCYVPKNLGSTMFLLDGRSSGYGNNPALTVVADGIMYLSAEFGGSQVSINCGTFTFGTKNRIALSYKLNDTAKVYFNGAVRASRDNFTGFTPFPMYIGSRYAVTGHSNGYFSNLRVSNKARTDAELANVGVLAVDEYTTYFAPMTTDLKAYTKGNGNAVLKSIAC